MEQLQRDNQSSSLRREAVLPPSSGPTRPCVLVGLSLVALCLAASLDAMLWQQAHVRQDAELELQQAKSQARSLAAQVSFLRAELRELRQKQRASFRAQRVPFACNHSLDDCAPVGNALLGKDATGAVKARLGDVPLMCHEQHHRWACAPDGKVTFVHNTW